MRFKMCMRPAFEVWLLGDIAWFVTESGDKTTMVGSYCIEPWRQLFGTEDEP